MMRRHYPAVTFACAVAALSWSCGHEVPPGADDSPSAEGRAVTLIGCVGAGPEPGVYQLDRIRADNNSAAPTPDLPQAPEVAGITEGAWVRLEGHTEQLAGLMGQKVKLTGIVTDTGENTIGTAGAWGNETPSGDESQAASDQHYSEKQKKEAGRIARQSLANGRAAKLQVRELTDLAERCELAPPVEKRR